MAENKLPFGEGASIHRPPMFSGINYRFWKIRMKIFIESIDQGIIVDDKLYVSLSYRLLSCF